MPRHKKVSAPSRRGDISLDIPFYRTCYMGPAGAVMGQTRFSVGTSEIIDRKLAPRIRSTHDSTSRLSHDKITPPTTMRGTMILPGETAAGSAGKQPPEG